MTAITVLQGVCYESNLPAPATIFNNTDPAALQLLHLLYSVGRELRQAKCWPQLKRTATITGDATGTYALASDFYASTLDTFWDRSNSRKIQQASDSHYNHLLYGVASSTTEKQYRIFGRTNEEQIQIEPEPATGETLSYDYISSFWIKTGASTWQETLGADADTFAFDDDLLILGVKARLYQAKGWDWQPYYQDFLGRISAAQARFQGWQKTTLYPVASRFIANYPEGSFG